MQTAIVLIRHLPEFRINAFTSGLKRLGYDIKNAGAYHSDLHHKPKPGDVLLTWNRHGNHSNIAHRWALEGGTVLVAENGWIGKDKEGTQYYALCRDHHNGAGTWHVGEEDRWAKLGIPLQPWRKTGSNLLLLPQRGIGEPGVAMPMHWPDHTQAALRKNPRKVVLRKHPGNHAMQAKHPVEEGLDDVWAAITWASGSAIKAIVAGVPVFYCFKKWIGASAAKYGLEDLENPFLGDRLPMLKRLAWAQWSLEELASGEPFRYLLIEGQVGETPVP
jgi:hypothetical protein